MGPARYASASFETFDRLVRTYPLAEIHEAERAALDGEVVKPVLVP
ncbi:hypothetical protein [Actinomycetospora sp. NBRC 106378]|nr:hypothetical protein [Actinomycetospora sp. NBRC 106378]GLZ55670.1 hypothetical protein Acsp07_52870 [Actinomycetospora sp. NBRC 106378]